MSILNFLKQPSKPTPNPNDAKTWGEFRELFAALRLLADKRYTSDEAREFRVYIWEGGEVHIEMEVRRNKFQGRGPDPWAAALDLATCSAALAAAVHGAMKQQSSERTE